MDTMAQTKQFLDYLATQDEAIPTYNHNDMILSAHSNSSYLSKPKAISHAGGYFFLSNNAEVPPNNGAMASTMKAHLADRYISSREAVYTCII